MLTKGFCKCNLSRVERGKRGEEVFMTVINLPPNFMTVVIDIPLLLNIVLDAWTKTKFIEMNVCVSLMNCHVRTTETMAHAVTIVYPFEFE
jgi:hypothetical protein